MTTYKATVEGTSVPGDIWMYGFHVIHDTGDVEELADLVTAWVPSLHNQNTFHTGTVARGVTTQRYDSGGTTVNASFEASLTSAGTNASWAPLPPQNAIAVTLDTNNAQRRGRCYLPQPAAQWVGTDGRFGGGKPAAIVGLFGDLWEALLAEGYAMCVKQSGGPDVNNVTRIRVGDIFDTQRRRRNRIGETYASWLPTPP